MSELKIETDIPMPRGRKLGFAKEFRNTLEVMRIGDSVFLDTKCKGITAYQLAKKMGVQIQTSKEGLGCRLWKVSNAFPAQMNTDRKVKVVS